MRLGEDAAALGHDAHAGAGEGVGARPRHLAALHEESARGRADLAGRDPDGGGLARPVGAEQRHHLPRGDVEIDTVWSTSMMP